MTILAEVSLIDDKTITLLNALSKAKNYEKPYFWITECA